MIAEILAAAALVVSPAAVRAPQYSFQPILDGLDSPVYVTAAPGVADTLYVVEQTGRIRTVQGGRVTGTFLDIADAVRSGGEQGLLSVAFSPGYAQNHLFYVNYTDKRGDTRVVEYQSDGTSAIPSTARELLFVKQPFANHNGGQLQFDRDGLLYVGMGDGGAGGDPGNRAQDLAVPLGKLLRIDPLQAGGAWQTIGYGLRNPWRFSFDRTTGDLWIGDVGQGRWEEIDYRSRASIGVLANYGWSRYEGREVFDTRKPLRKSGGLVFPVLVYSHRNNACSITGGYVYRGTAVPAAAGRYFYGDYCTGNVFSFQVGAGRASAPRQEAPVIRDGLSSFGEGGDGELYATSLGGKLYRLTQ